MCAAPKGHPNYDTEGLAGRPKIYTDEFIDNLADELMAWLDSGKFIWFERFALEKKIDPDLMSEFASTNEKFSGAYKLAKQHQKVRLIECGLVKKYQYNLVQLLLGHHYGIFEKKQNVISGGDDNSLRFILENIDGQSKELVKSDG